MTDRYLEMLYLQKRLNDNTNGENWEFGKNDSGRTIDWIRCIWMEAAEAADSFRWKHWKDVAGGVDLDNLRLEMVDIWHFVMSEVLRQARMAPFSAELAAFSIRVLRKEEGGSDSLDAMYESLVLSAAAKMAFYGTAARNENSGISIEDIGDSLDDNRIDYCVREIEDFAEHALHYRRDAGYDQALELARRFLVLADKFGVGGEALYAEYVGKNVLNQFRQDHGYKEGTYNKNGWGDNGDEEDNAVMKRIMRSNSAISPEELYRKLEEAYPEKA